MMQVNELRKQFNHVEDTIDQAAQVCRMEPGVPSELMQCIEALDEHTQQARQAMQSEDENQIRHCVDQLEMLGDRAKRACENAGNINDGLRDAVMQAHSELSSLKHQMH